MKEQIKDFIGADRWAKLETQAVEQGVRLDAVADHAATSALAAHPASPALATALAALKVIVGCNSQPTLEEITRYELAKESVGQHSPKEKQSQKKGKQE